MEWISVNDKLPQDDIDVLCLFTGWDDMQFQRVLSYDELEKEWVDWEGYTHNKITHWMPLPNPPKT